MKPGLHIDRLARDNPRETAFAEQWALENKRHHILFDLLTVPCEPDAPGAYRAINGGTYRQPIGELTARDEQIASTVVQWLGSNCGISFLEESLKRCGYRIERHR